MKLLRSIRAGALGILVLCLSSLSLSAQDDPRVQEVVRLAKANDWKAALTEAESIKDPSLRVLALCNLAKRQVLADERGEAQLTLKSIPALTRKIDDTFLRIKAIGFLGEIQVEAGDRVTGMATLDRALREARAEKDVRGAIGALVDVAQRRFRMGDTEGGRTTFAAAVDLAPRLGSSQERIALLLHIDKILAGLRDSEGRRAVLAAAVPYACQVVDVETAFKVLLSIGDKQLAVEDRHGFGETMAVARRKARAIGDVKGRARMTMVIVERFVACGLSAEARLALGDIGSHQKILEGFAKKPEYTAEIQLHADTVLAFALLQIEVDDRALGWTFLKDAVTHMRVDTDQILARALAGLMQHEDWGRALEASALLAEKHPDEHVRRLDVIWRGALKNADYETADLVALQYPSLRVHFDRRMELTEHLLQTGHPELARACMEIAEKICALIDTKDDEAIAADPTHRVGTTVQPFPDLWRRALCVQSWIRLGRHNDAALAVKAAHSRAKSKLNAEARVDALLALAETFADLELATQSPQCWAAAIAIAKDARYRDSLIERIADSQAFAGAIVSALATVELIGRDSVREKCRSRLFDRSIAEHASATERRALVEDRLAIARSFGDRAGRFAAYVALTGYYVDLAHVAIAADDSAAARRAAVDATAWLEPEYKPLPGHAVRYAEALAGVAELWTELGEDSKAAAIRAR